MRVWIFSEEAGGAPSAGSLELAACARGLGDEVAAVYVGSGSDAAFGTLGEHGVTRVFHLDPGDALAAPPVAAAMADLVGEHAPDLILFSLGYTDRDVAGRLSARTGQAIVSNAVEVTADDGAVEAVNEILGGTTLVRSRFSGDGPKLVIVRPKSYPAEASGGGSPEVIAVPTPDVGHAGAATISDRQEEQAEGPQLEEADVIVSGGRGVGDADKFEVVERLAKVLGAAVGATRAVVDAGWVPYSMQVGQTGKTVKPNVYLALGISGAMQHLVGMKDSGIIIAVNKDEEAPIFGIADLGIVGDLHQVVPRLIDALQARS